MEDAPGLDSQRPSTWDRVATKRDQLGGLRWSFGGGQGYGRNHAPAPSRELQPLHPGCGKLHEHRLGPFPHAA